MDYTNNSRNILITIIKNEFSEEISQNIVTVNEFGDIPIDYKVEGSSCKLTFYIRKITSSYTELYPLDNGYESSHYKIGIRSCEPISNLNGKVAEDYIYRLWRLFRFNDQLECNYLIEVTNEHYLLSKDPLDRYFWEFEIKITNR